MIFSESYFRKISIAMFAFRVFCATSSVGSVDWRWRWCGAMRCGWSEMIVMRCGTRKASTALSPKQVSAFWTKAADSQSQPLWRRIFIIIAFLEEIVRLLGIRGDWMAIRKVVMRLKRTGFLLLGGWVGWSREVPSPDRKRSFQKPVCTTHTSGGAFWHVFTRQVLSRPPSNQPVAQVQLRERSCRLLAGQLLCDAVMLVFRVWWRNQKVVFMGFYYQTGSSSWLGFDFMAVASCLGLFWFRETASNRIEWYRKGQLVQLNEENQNWSKHFLIKFFSLCSSIKFFFYIY